MMRVTKMLYSRATLQMSFFKALVIGGCLLMLLGCREYKLYHYEEISDEVLGGELKIEATASRTLAEENGNKIAIESNPYSLQFKFFSKENFKKIDIEELVLIGLDSNNKIDLSGASSLEARPFPETDKYFAIATFSSQLEGVELRYEEYDLKAVLYLRRLDGETEKNYISYRLKTKYKAESRSDIIDGMMGIQLPLYMNGRVYDPKIARFLSADPFVQAPHNLQSYNRYAYVINDPLNATDPSGFFLKKIKKTLKN